MWVHDFVLFCFVRAYLHKSEIISNFACNGLNFLLNCNISNSFSANKYFSVIITTKADHARPVWWAKQFLDQYLYDDIWVKLLPFNRFKWTHTQRYIDVYKIVSKFRIKIFFWKMLLRLIVIIFMSFLFWKMSQII